MDLQKLITKKSINLDKIKDAPWFLAKHAFAVVVLLILLDLILGGVLIYKYVFWAQENQAEIIDNSLKFKDNVYQTVLKDWQQREENLKFSSEFSQSPFK